MDNLVIMKWVVGIAIFLCTVTIHEWSHGFVAYCLGDQTAKRAGRLTLNPLKHLDLFWTILLPVAMLISTSGRMAFGMAKPVPVNFRELHPPRLGMVAVAAAGPLSNLILAFVLAVTLFNLHGVRPELHAEAPKP